jgi:aspartyl-tRNA(Asn)/glutamyl-tRNA(Gln) amidotransferase subunit A
MTSHIAAERCERSLARAATAAARSALITTTSQRAVHEAELSDARRRAGRARSELDGTPIVWKDLFDVAGTTTTCGSAVAAHRSPARVDSALVRRAGRLGLVTIAKANLSEFRRRSAAASAFAPAGTATAPTTSRHYPRRWTASECWRPTSD